MRKYRSIFRIRFLNGMQYRTVMFGAIATRLAWVFMEILAYSVLYQMGNRTLPMEFSQMVSYIWLKQTMRVLFAVVFGDQEIYGAIESGTIAYELVRPVDLYGRWFWQSAAGRIAYLVLDCLPVLAVGFLVPGPYRITLPGAPVQFAAFLLSLMLTVGVVVAFAMLMYISMFYILAQRGVKVMVSALTGFLSGEVIPLPFFPEPVRSVVQLLPFAAMQDIPLRIYSGNICGRDMGCMIGLQLFWFCVLILAGKAAMASTLKRVVVQGG